MAYTKKDKLTAMLLYRTAMEAVPAHNQSKAIESLLQLAITYAREGIDFSVIDELEYA